MVDTKVTELDLQKEVDAQGAEIDMLKQEVQELAPEVTALGQDEAASKYRLLQDEAQLGVKPPAPVVVPDPEPAGGE